MSILTFAVKSGHKESINDNDVSIPRALAKEQLFKMMPVCEYIIINNFISTPTRVLLNRQSLLGLGLGSTTEINQNKHVKAVLCTL